MSEFIEVISKILVLLVSIFGSVLLSIVVFIVLLIIFGISLHIISARKEREAELLREPERQKKRQREQDEARRNLVFETLGVEFDTLDDIETQDEIVRIVNLHAIEVAKACVAQDTTARRKKEEDFDKSPDERVKRAKRHWAEKRKIALALLPELAERIPHFSEFEPLKSYNAEHLLRKKGVEV